MRQKPEVSSYKRALIFGDTWVWGLGPRRSPRPQAAAGMSSHRAGPGFPWTLVRCLPQALQRGPLARGPCQQDSECPQLMILAEL